MDKGGGLKMTFGLANCLTSPDVPGAIRSFLDLFRNMIWGEGGSSLVPSDDWVKKFNSF